MADIFISYSKADHALALKLSAFFESEGWSVWWDKSLAVADLYRDEIMKQLAAARAVITIWSPNSVKSDWVRAEAGRAKADGKLIPVKTPDVAYGDIPLPFGEMHTENVGSTDLIKRRLLAMDTAPEGKTGLPEVAVREYCFLQLRMLCELIALGCLTAQGDLQTGKLKDEYRADKIIRRLQQLHPDFYPYMQRHEQKQG